MSLLRSKIDSVINGGAGTLREQREKIEALKEDYDHSINFIEYRDPQRPFNCFSFALDVVDSMRINDILKTDASSVSPKGVKFGTDFVLQLITSGVLKQNSGGEVIVYFCAQRPVHAGKIKGERVTSKWGTDNLWEHGIWEVPAMYGDAYQTFSKVTVEEVEDEFEKHYKGLD